MAVMSLRMPNNVFEAIDLFVQLKVIPLCQPCLFSPSLSKVKVGQNSYNNKATE
jgi:hypothetical protein